AIAVAELVAAGGCHNAARDLAERDARDRARLAAVVDADQVLDRAFKAADDASRAGQDAKAADLLEGEVVHAAADAIAEAEREPLESAWAKARRDALVRVLRDRQASIAPYAQATRGEDLEAKLAAVQTQIELQKRALAAAARALSPPGDDATEIGAGSADSG
ncbi:MAG TPA: hypothetical protein VGI39_23320, partial [Polyangiaceae bacterium]